METFCQKPQVQCRYQVPCRIRRIGTVWYSLLGEGTLRAFLRVSSWINHPTPCSRSVPVPSLQTATRRIRYRVSLLPLHGAGTRSYEKIVKGFMCFFSLWQCCGYGIRCLFDRWISDPGSPTHIFESWEKNFLLKSTVILWSTIILCQLANFFPVSYLFKKRSNFQFCKICGYTKRKN